MIPLYHKVLFLLKINKSQSLVYKSNLPISLASTFETGVQSYLDSSEEEPLLGMWFSKDEAVEKARMRWERIEELRKQDDSRVRGNEVLGPKIQKVPVRMRGREEFRKFYSPSLISIGPFHCSRDGYSQGDEYKRLWIASYLQDTNQTYDFLFERVYYSFDDEENRERLWDSYNSADMDLFIRDWSPVELQLILMEDGCSVLHVLDKSLDSDSPTKELMVSTDHLVRVHQDLLLWEKQLPYKILRLVCSDNPERLKRCLHNFLAIHGIQNEKELRSNDGHGELMAQRNITIVQEEEEPFQLLDYLRRALLRRDQNQIPKEIKLKKKRGSLHLRKYRIGTIRELIAAGIQVTKCPNSTSFYPSFNNGQLQLPEITVDGSTAVMFLNLIAYEMCPHFMNDFEISSFIVFLSSLIDQPEDVKELRRVGILRNELANDKEVADLFNNKMDYILVPETHIYAQIRDEIEDHFVSKRGKIKVLGWMGEAYNNYFRSPWAVIALLAAMLGLTLTFIQTWYAIHPKG